MKVRKSACRIAGCTVKFPGSIYLGISHKNESLELRRDNRTVSLTGVRDVDESLVSLSPGARCLNRLANGKRRRKGGRGRIVNRLFSGFTDTFETGFVGRDASWGLRGHSSNCTNPAVAV